MIFIYSVIEENNKKISVAEVKDCVERHGSMAGHFRFFETYMENNEF